MAMSNPVERQYPLVARVQFVIADFAVSGTGEAAITLPVNSIVTGGQIVITTVFDSVTTDTLDVGDASSAVRYLTGASDNAQTLQGIPLVPTGFVTTGSEPSIEIRWTQTGGAGSAGAGYLEVEYVIVGRGNEAQP